MTSFLNFKTVYTPYMHNPHHILITGASSGLGAALALVYAAQGITLSLHGRNAARLAQVAEQARQSGAAVETHVGDVSDATEITAWIALRDSTLPIDLVIANAGISAGTSGKNGETLNQVNALFATNVTGVFNTVHPVLAPMTKRKQGQIAIISSVASFRGFPGAPAYCASKAAVRVYGEGLRGEMAPHNLAVNVVCPGFIKTPMTDVNRFRMPFIMSPERAAQIIRKGLERNQARIAFPWPTYALALLLAALPQPMIDWIAARTPKK